MAWRHETIIQDQPAMVREHMADGLRQRVSPELKLNATCAEIVPSWNVAVPRGGGFTVALRVRRQDDVWSGWHTVGIWGTANLSPNPAPDPWLEVEVDTLKSDLPLKAVQYALISGPGSAEDARVERFALCCTRPAEGADLAITWRDQPQPVRLEVPFRSQFSKAPEVASRLCSPACVAMVLSYYGIDPPFEAVASACYDPHHDLYGNWPRAVQAAFSFGVTGYVTRFHDLQEAWGVLCSGRPIVASIAFDEGGLPGAPVPRTDGHLVVVCGATPEGDLLVNDPAAPPGSGTLVYGREPFAAAWFGHRGTAYVFDPPAG